MQEWREVTIEVTKEQAREIVYGDSAEFTMISEEICSVSRWSIHYDGVCQHRETGKYYLISWETGATELQDEEPFDYEDGPVVLIEAAPTVVTTVKYFAIKEQIFE